MPAGIGIVVRQASPKGLLSAVASAVRANGTSIVHRIKRRIWVFITTSSGPAALDQRAGFGETPDIAGSGSREGLGRAF